MAEQPQQDIGSDAAETITLDYSDPNLVVDFLGELVTAVALDRSGNPVLADGIPHTQETYEAFIARVRQLPRRVSDSLVTFRRQEIERSKQKGSVVEVAGRLAMQGGTAAIIREDGFTVPLGFHDPQSLTHLVYPLAPGEAAA